jgi:hypothetical protein
VGMDPELNPELRNLAELQARMRAVPFVPFRIILSGGKVYEVPTVDHLSISRLLHRVSVEYDNWTAAYINLLHITSIEPLTPAGNA